MYTLPMHHLGHLFIKLALKSECESLLSTLPVLWHKDVQTVTLGSIPGP